MRISLSFLRSSSPYTTLTCLREAKIILDLKYDWCSMASASVPLFERLPSTSSREVSNKRDETTGLSNVNEGDGPTQEDNK